jgi:hypothetical protein
MKKIKKNLPAKFEDKTLQVILTQAGLPQEFRTIGKKELQVIADNMPAVYRNMEIYGRKNSQVMGKMMSLQMLRHGPYNAIRQCDSMINSKREALKENGFKLMKENNDLELLYEQLLDDNLTKHQKKDIEIDIMKKECGIADARVSIEHALKEIYMYMMTKKEIMEKHNISDTWSEEEFIGAEIKENIQTAFQHAVRDIQMTGRLNVGTCEWLEQFGINPAIALVEVVEYLKTLNSTSDITNLYSFYDDMYDRYKDEYKKAMDRLGIKNLITEEISYKED